MENKYMKIALEEAKKSYAKNEVPVGAVLICNDKIISVGHNMKETLNNPMKHAEMIAIEEACKEMNTWHLDNCELYITLEPCLMCYGAILESRIKKITYAASNKKYGYTNYIKTTFEEQKGIEVNRDIMSEESVEILRKFFKTKRE